MRRYAALVVSVTVALVLFPSPYECTAGDHPDKLQILSLLEKRDFAALDRLLKGDQVAAFTDLKKACDLGNGNACRLYDREHGQAGAAK